MRNANVFARMHYRQNFHPHLIFKEPCSKIEHIYAVKSVLSNTIYIFIYKDLQITKPIEGNRFIIIRYVNGSSSFMFKIMIPFIVQLISLYVCLYA